MGFHQIIQTCATDHLDFGDEVSAEAEYINPDSGAMEVESISMTLDEVLHKSANKLYKADVVVGYAQGIIVVGDLEHHGQFDAARDVASAMAKWLEAAASSLNDEEVEEMAELMDKLHDNIPG